MARALAGKRNGAPTDITLCVVVRRGALTDSHKTTGKRVPIPPQYVAPLATHILTNGVAGGKIKIDQNPRQSLEYCDLNHMHISLLQKYCATHYFCNRKIKRTVVEGFERK